MLAIKMAEKKTRERLLDTSCAAIPHRRRAVGFGS
jgi:hypothetical protein